MMTAEEIVYEIGLLEHPEFEEMILSIDDIF